LLALIGNNDIVIAFKKRLVKAFFELSSTYALSDVTASVMAARVWAVKRKMDLAAAWRYKKSVGICASTGSLIKSYNSTLTHPHKNQY
jgi:hypothetical protein